MLFSKAAFGCRSLCEAMGFVFVSAYFEVLRSADYDSVNLSWFCIGEFRGDTRELQNVIYFFSW